MENKKCSYELYFSILNINRYNYIIETNVYHYLCNGLMSCVSQCTIIIANFGRDKIIMSINGH